MFKYAVSSGQDPGWRHLWALGRWGGSSYPAMQQASFLSPPLTVTSQWLHKENSKFSSNLHFLVMVVLEKLHSWNVIWLVNLRRCIYLPWAFLVTQWLRTYLQCRDEDQSLFCVYTNWIYCKHVIHFIGKFLIWLDQENSISQLFSWNKKMTSPLGILLLTIRKFCDANIDILWLLTFFTVTNSQIIFIYYSWFSNTT